MKTLTIFNEKAQSKPHFDAVLQAVKGHGSTLKPTGGGEDAAKNIREFLKSGCERIVIVGGDGTISAVVRALCPEFPPVELAIIPFGTGNDLARSLDVPINDVELAIEAAFQWSAEPIDVIRVTNGDAEFFVNAVSGGFGAEVTGALTDENKQFWGSLSYWIAAIGMLGNLHEHAVTIECDGQRIEEKIYGLAVSNGKFLGGGFPIAPTAVLNDGLMDVTIVPVMAVADMVAAGVEVCLAGTVDSPHLQRLRTKSMRLTTQPEMFFSIDGEVERRLNAQFDVLPKKLHFCAGPQAILVNRKNAVALAD